MKTCFRASENILNKYVKLNADLCFIKINCNYNYVTILHCNYIDKTKHRNTIN